MVEHKTEERNGRQRTTITLKPGERVSLCRCMHSKELPFCDGSHKIIATTTGPAVVEVPAETQTSQA